MIAYGYLELTPAEFYDLTPRELFLMYQGWKMRERRKAYYLQLLLYPHYGKKTPPIEKILGFSVDDVDRVFNPKPKRISREEGLSMLQALEREMMSHNGGESTKRDGEGV